MIGGGTAQAPPQFNQRASMLAQLHLNADARAPLHLLTQVIIEWNAELRCRPNRTTTQIREQADLVR